MAKKDENKKTLEQESTNAAAKAEPRNAEAKAEEEALAQAAPEAASADKAKAGAKNAELASIEELANAQRLPTWQSAALNRLMGWGSGKKVTEAEYKAALNKLKNRRIGG